jgi:hypothetical protein
MREVEQIPDCFCSSDLGVPYIGPRHHSPLAIAEVVGTGH